MRLLQGLGFKNLRLFSGGMMDWNEGGGPVERGMASPPVLLKIESPPRIRRKRISPLRRTADGVVAFFDSIASRSVGQVIGAWLAMIVAFGLLYWVVEVSGGRALLDHGVPVPATWEGLVTAIYFSFVTATSVGYGDVIPIGWMRFLAILEAASGLLIIGFMVSKFLSRRQEEMIEAIHRIAFEDRLDSVQTSLHLVLSDLQQISDDCADGGEPKPRSIARAESATMVFAGELRTIHDLLYRPERVPDEEVLEAILANLAAAFGALSELLACMPSARKRSQVLETTISLISRLGSEICGECVPRAYAPALKIWMDRIQRQAEGLATR